MTHHYQVQMTVDEDGKVTACSFVQDGTIAVAFAGHDALDRCAIALRKEFRRAALSSEFDRIIAAAPDVSREDAA